MGLEKTDTILFNEAFKKIELDEILQLVDSLRKDNLLCILGFDQFRDMFPVEADEIFLKENLYLETQKRKFCSKSIETNLPYLSGKKVAVLFLGLSINGFESSNSYKFYNKLSSSIVSYSEPIQKHFADFAANRTFNLIFPYFKENRKIKISFIILSGLNNSVSLKKMLISFKKNTPAASNIEVIVVINGSSDNSRIIPHQVLGLKYNLKVIQNPNNLGISGGYNEGIDCASGDYICLLQDDILLSKKDWHLELSYYLDKHENIGIIGGFRAGYYFKNEAKTNLTAPYLSIGTSVIGNPNWPYMQKYLVEADCANCMAVMFRREIGRYDEHFLPNGLEDIVFCFEARRNGYSVYVTDVGIYHGLKSATRFSKRSFFNFFRKKKKRFEQYEKRLSRWYHFKIFYERYSEQLREIPKNLHNENINLKFIESITNVLPKDWKKNI